MTKLDSTTTDADADHPTDVARFEGLHTALICDVLDGLGHRTGFLGPDVVALADGMRVVGRAFTLRTEPVEEVPEHLYAMLLASYSDMSSGEVLVIGTGGENVSGIWGELLSIAATARGVAGVVTDGLVRDVHEIRGLGFPTFSQGASPLDSAGRQDFVATQAPVRIGACLIEPGDLIVGDHMGVVSIPKALMEQVAELGQQRRQGEDEVRRALESGQGIASVFDEYGLL